MQPRSCRCVVTLVERKAAGLILRPRDSDPVIQSHRERQRRLTLGPCLGEVAQRLRDCSEAEEPVGNNRLEIELPRQSHGFLQPLAGRHIVRLLACRLPK
jgi:hypothetical protein